MRFLTALLTAVTAATLAGFGGSGVGALALADAPCTPHVSAWTWPLAPGAGAPGPIVLRPFQPPRHRWDPGHRGVDLAGYGGEPVVAAGKGVVLFAGLLVDRSVVVVGHGVLRTTYEPVVPDPAAVVGAQVSRGQRLGTLEAGHCTGAVCLHWGLVAGHGHAAVYYDPLLLLGCGRVRLEPVDPTGPGAPYETPSPPLRSAPSPRRSGTAANPVGDCSRSG
jgi:murein DD-endopeptidase MepM/ murein hydrolase activator NlpD